MNQRYDKPYANSKPYIDGFTDAFQDFPNFWFIYLKIISDPIYKEGYYDGIEEKKNNANITLHQK